MSEREDLDIEVCVVCGEEVDLEDSRTYCRMASTIACFECARKHGGIFDPSTEKWTAKPRLPSSHVRKHREDY